MGSYLRPFPFVGSRNESQERAGLQLLHFIILFTLGGSKTLTYHILLGLCPFSTKGFNPQMVCEKNLKKLAGKWNLDPGVGSSTDLDRPQEALRQVTIIPRL